jgi:hypothetical protein
MHANSYKRGGGEERGGLLALKPSVSSDLNLRYMLASGRWLQTELGFCRVGEKLIRFLGYCRRFKAPRARSC